MPKLPDNHHEKRDEMLEYSSLRVDKVDAENSSSHFQSVAEPIVSAPKMCQNCHWNQSAVKSFMPSNIAMELGSGAFYFHAV